MEKKDTVTAEDIVKLKEQLGDPGIGPKLRIVENAFLPDDMIVVSSRMYNQLNKTNETLSLRDKGN